MTRALALFRAVLLSALLALGLPPWMAQAATVTDLAGRKVDLPAKVERILLGEGRLITSMAILEGSDPFARIVGWHGDFRGLDIQSYAAYQARFPHADDIPLVGAATPDTFNVEQALALKPQLVLLSIAGGHGPTPDSDAVRQFEASGVPVLFVDFNAHPLANTIPSMRLLGQALQREAAAQAYIDWYAEQRARVTEVLAAARAQPGFQRPSVFVDLLAGLRDCCGAPGRAGLGELIEQAGGHNIGAARIANDIGTLNAEYVLASNPDVYIATGVFPRQHGGVALGFAATPQAAAETLDAVAHRTETAALRAVRNGRVHGLWHVYYNSPEHLIALQAMAKWLHPALFAALDPTATREAFYHRFMPIPPTGVFFVDTPAAPADR